MGREQFFTEPTGCEKIEGIFSHRVPFLCEKNSITYFHHSQFRYIFDWKSTPSRRSSRGFPEPLRGHSGSLQARNPNAHPDTPTRTRPRKPPKHQATCAQVRPHTRRIGMKKKYDRNQIVNHRLSKSKFPMDRNY